MQFFETKQVGEQPSKIDVPVFSAVVLTKLLHHFLKASGTERRAQRSTAALGSAFSLHKFCAALAI